MSVTKIALARIPGRWRPLLVTHRELVKFTLVGGTCFLLTMAVNYALRLTVLGAKPVTALTIATLVATIVSYLLNRHWSFRSNGSHRREAVLFCLVSGLAILVNDVPLYVARYVLHLRRPYLNGFSLELSDFVSGMIIGTLLAMAFRWWAMRRFVFVDRKSRTAPPVSTPTRTPERVG